MNYPELDSAINALLQEGAVIPAHPLALDEDRNLDEARQRLLTQYYIASGAGGVAVGGRLLSYNFWRALADIPNVYGIKVAAFNRYQTLDVVRAVCDSKRKDQIALYTGNDDNIVADLLTPYRFNINGSAVEKRFVGGLLGHWAVWTKSAVALLQRIKSERANSQSVEQLLAEGIKITDMNAAIFDPANSFKGCIPGIHEVLRRQGLLKGRWCINPDEQLSPGQMEEISRVIMSYPEHTDDDFVRNLLEKMNVSAV